MADFIVEDGVGRLTATSLVSLEYADSYFSSHPYYADSWQELEEQRKKNLLMFASRAVCDMTVFGGFQENTSLPFPFPRTTFVGVPDALKRAVCEMAYFYSTPGGNTDAGSAGGVEELKIDVIQIKFAGATTARSVPTAVVRLLRSLSGGTNNSKVRRVQVGLA